jgi:hypothetical protein
MNFLTLPTPSRRTMPWGSLSLQQKRVPEAEKCFWGVECGRCVGLAILPPSLSRLSRQCGIFNISQPYTPVKGRALPLYTYYVRSKQMLRNEETARRQGRLPGRARERLPGRRGCRVLLQYSYVCPSRLQHNASLSAGVPLRYA